MDGERLRFFYRVSKKVPPDDAFYLTPQEKYGDPPAGAPEETRRVWDALSFYTSEEGARLCGKEHTHLGGKIVRFRWDPPDEEGHCNVRGDKAALERFRDVDYFARVHQ